MAEKSRDVLSEVLPNYEYHAYKKLEHDDNEEVLEQLHPQHARTYIHHSLGNGRRPRLSPKARSRGVTETYLLTFVAMVLKQRSK